MVKKDNSDITDSVYYSTSESDTVLKNNKAGKALYDLWLDYGKAENLSKKLGLKFDLVFYIISKKSTKKEKEHFKLLFD
jgi:hypothetical protein